MRKIKWVRVAIAAALVVAAVLGFQAVQSESTSTAFAQNVDKVTICHATGGGRFVGISTPAQTLLGANGHFDANGNPQQGHEQDFVAVDGDCDTHNDPPHEH
jgi:hypothetical protein